MLNKTYARSHSKLRDYANFLSRNPDFDDYQMRVIFPNGRGVSVIRRTYMCMNIVRPSSYGADDGLYELAVLDCHGWLDYTTPLTDDVLGHLAPKDVLAAMLAVFHLPADMPRQLIHNGRKP